MQEMRQQLDQGKFWVQHQETPDDHTAAMFETKIDTTKLWLNYAY